MQDSWQQLESGSTSWQMTLKNSHNLQNQWHVVSTFCQEMNNYLTRKVGFEETPKLGPCWKSQPASCKINMEWKQELNLWTKTILTRGTEFLIAWIKLVTELSNKEDDDNDQETSEMKFEDCALKTNVLAFCEPIKGQSKTTTTYFCLLIYKNCTYRWKILDLYLSQEQIRISLSQCQNDWLLFFVMVIYLEKKMERLNSGDWKIIFGTNLRILDIGLMKCGRAKWQEAEVTRKDFKIVLIHQGQEILYLRALQGHSGRNPIDPSLQDNVRISNNFFEYIYHIGCAIKFAFHHEFRIDTRRTKLEQKTDGILYVCGSFEQRTQRSKQNWPGSTTFCMVQAEKVEETAKHCALGRHKTCSKEKI